jgi:hypothetical protein
MSKGIEKLKRDLAILSSMTTDMVNYLSSDILYWPSMEMGYPELTLGGYWMRLDRLSILSDLLDETEQTHLADLLVQFRDSAAGNVVKLELKASRELKARLRQWEQRLQDFEKELDVSKAYYANDAQVRLIITTLIEKLGEPPYRLDSLVLDQVTELDSKLRANWQVGPFIWPEDWLPAYPEDLYWWLYGIPAAPADSWD